MSDAKIILNQIQCNHCKDIITSHHRHMFVVCSCGTVSADGGRVYTKRSFKTKGDYTDLSVFSFEDFSIIRQVLCRGSRGEDSKQPLTWISLASINDSYLDNLIKYCEDNGEVGGDYSYYLKEKEWRMGESVLGTVIPNT